MPTITLTSLNKHYKISNDIIKTLFILVRLSAVAHVKLNIILSIGLSNPSILPVN